MAAVRWKGRGLPVADVWTLAIGGTWATNDTLTLTVNGRDIVITVGATTTNASIATAVEEAWNGDDATGNATRSETGDNIPEFAEWEASVNSTTATFTGTTKGRPGTISRTLSSASGTATLTHATTGTGPNNWDNADNWDTGAVPVSTDTVYIDNSEVDILYGLDQSAVTLAALYIGMSFTGRIGLPEVNEEGDYLEYRDQYLKVGATVLRVGDGTGIGSGRIKLDTGSAQTACTVVDTGTPADPDLPALVWKGTHASNALVMRAGSVGAAVFGAEVATLNTFQVDDGDLRLGRGVTLTSGLSVNGGTVSINSLVDGSLTMLGGDVTIDGTGNVDQLTVRGGTCVYKTTGTLGGNTVVGGSGVLDFSQDPVTKTVTNAIDLHGQSSFIIDTDKVVATLVVDFNEGARPEQVQFGDNIRLTRGTPA